MKVLRLNQKALSLHDAQDQDRDLPDLQAVYPTREALPQFVGELEALWAGLRQYTSRKSLPSVTGLSMGWFALAFIAFLLFAGWGMKQLEGRFGHLRPGG